MGFAPKLFEHGLGSSPQAQLQYMTLGWWGRDDDASLVMVMAAAFVMGVMMATMFTNSATLHETMMKTSSSQKCGGAGWMVTRPMEVPVLMML